MNLLYEVISDHIDYIIKKKRTKEQQYLETCNIEKNEHINKKVYNIHRDINYLNIIKYKLKEIFSFIQDIDNSL